MPDYVTGANYHKGEGINLGEDDRYILYFGEEVRYFSRF